MRTQTVSSTTSIFKGKLEREKERVDKQINKHYHPSKHIPPITVWQSKTEKKNPLTFDLDLLETDADL